MEEKSPQARRLQKFVDLTGYSVNEFAKQCKIPSTRTLTRILTDGGKPSSKILDKIINRFPQLNHDWVVLGYGEMIVKGFENKEVTADSLQKSTQASFGTIQQSMSDHDFSLNELAKAVRDAITRVDTMSAFVMEAAKNSLEKQELLEKLFFEKVDNKIQEVDQHVAQLFHLLNERDQEQADKEDRRIEKLDAQRRELREKDMQVLFEQFDRLAKRTELTSENIINSLRENTAKAIEELSKNSNKNTKDAMDYLGILTKTKKP
jgi:transcriptional regulator with XRE-family HTH domain